jgi:alpha-beta hydrolase superfamily lysophospholipase
MARRDEGYLTSKDGLRLFWRSAMPDGAPTAMVGIVHGYGDHSGRYLATMDALVAQGLGTIAFDYRGHGQADGKRADVKAWSDYLDDLEAFWRKAREQAAGVPLFLLAHSNGSLIATHWAAQRPAGLAGLILSAPFYALAFKPPAAKLFAARLIKGVLPGLSLSNELNPEQLSRDVAWQQQTAADRLYLHTTTPRWFFETQAAQARLAGLGKELTGPVLMLAGGDDPVAAMPAARGFFDTIAATDKTWKEYAGFRHEVLNEVGKEQVLDDIARWISAHR